MTSAPHPSTAAFTLRHWAVLACVALMWGSSFLLIKIGLEDFPPATVAWLRIAFGALALVALPAARAPLRHRGDGRLVAVLGVVWMGVPFMLLTVAQQHIPSALAGMINGAAPLFTATIAALWFKQAPGLRLLSGLGVGFAGVLAIGLPNVEGTASLFGVVLVLAATALYGVAFNLSGVLQSRNGALPVIWRAQLVALVVVAPFGVPGLVGSTPSPRSALAMVALGALGTGLAFVLFTGLVGRVGAPRAAITNYVMPVIALGLGAGLAGESIAALSLAGVVLVLLGAYVATSARRGRSRNRRTGQKGLPALTTPPT